ncbi:hypothetical protein BOTBODRAFT_51293 [Botryobasidium botryosum FD-172 SS1]|uniref:NUDE domain-containing protein n=1 Tax=Botryobasidium botryosum (strain FD-172 SS1) TaxID=930990 RepID=A0A067N729_BOTB1|nr:hypothetical protein BOTBODRAFT_51293 [Botryobasidium botryosum FD-172 SS1]
MDSSHEDDSCVDWKAKYEEVAALLAQTQDDLDDFQTSSKDIEDELERELERTEEAQKALRQQISKLEIDRDEWKNKFMTLQTTHNNTANSMQRELEALRQSTQIYKVKLRELEIGNDDLERNERAVTSSLADLEGRYARALEEKILLEHELQDKGQLEEELQRLRDELKDVNADVVHLKEKLARPPVVEPLPVPTPPPSTGDDSESTLSSQDLQLTDLIAPIPQLARQSSLVRNPRLDRLGQIKSPSPTNPSSRIASMHRPLPVLPRPPVTPPAQMRPTHGGRSTSISSVAGTASKSKGVQMVSEMRARVRTLEMKIHSRVPRLRSVSGRFYDDPKEKVQPHTRSPGWVIITEEGQPVARAHSPAESAGSRPGSKLGAFQLAPIPGSSAQTIRRPISRLSSASSTSINLPPSASTHSFLSTPPNSSTSRPCTPTLIPTPITASSSSTSLAASTTATLKRPARRSSLAASKSLSQSTTSPSRRPVTMHTLGAMRPPPVPALPKLHKSQEPTLPLPSGMVRSKSIHDRARLGLGKSRIGKPSSLPASRTSPDSEGTDQGTIKGRSATMGYPF